MVRLKDIAEQAGVSVMTVSKALRDEPDVSPATKTRVKLLAQQLAYVPDSTAQGLRNRKTRLFGLVIPSLANPIFARMVLAIEGRAYELGYEVLLAQTHDIPEREDACIRRFLSRRADGLFLSPVYRHSDEARVYQELLERSVPTIILDHPAPFCSQFVSIESEDVLGSQAATKHLLELGHKRIAFLAGPQIAPWSQERFEGYRRALREADLEVDDKLIFQAGRTIEEGAIAACQLINEAPDITAIQAVNDLVAIGCADTLLKQGIKVPEDLSVVGFGNTALSEYFRVPLTTLNQPKFRLGAAAMDAMQQLLRGQRPSPKRLPAELIVRDSSGTPSASPRFRQLKAAKSETAI